MYIFFIVSKLKDTLPGFIYHAAPAAEHKVGRRVLFAQNFIDRVDIAAMAIPFFARERGMISECGKQLFEFSHFIGIQKVLLRTRAEDEMQFGMRQLVRGYVPQHAPERRDTCAGAHHKKFFFYDVRQYEYAVRTAQGQFG